MKTAVIVHEDKRLKSEITQVLRNLDYRVETHNTLSAWHKTESGKPCDLFIVNGMPEKRKENGKEKEGNGNRQ